MDKESLIKQGLTEEQADAVMKALDGEYVPKTRFNELNDQKKKAEGDLGTRTKEFEALRAQSGDATAQTAEIARLQGELEAEKAAREADRATWARDAAIEKALIGAGTHNPKAAMALLDQESITMEGGKLSGLDDQLKALKASDPYLFAEEGSKPVFRGVTPAEGRDKTAPAPNPFAEKTFNLTEQGKLTRDDPKLAEQLRRAALG